MDKTRKNNNAARRLAGTAANLRTRARFGRLGQTRVANLLRPAEGPHNIVARTQRNFRKEEMAKLESIVDKSKDATLTIRSLKKQLSDSILAAKRAGSSKITLEMPIGTATALLRVLTFIIGLLAFIVYWGVNIFVGFFSAGTVMLGDTPNEILNMIDGDFTSRHVEWD